MTDFFDSIDGAAIQQGQIVSSSPPLFTTPGGLYVMNDLQSQGHQVPGWSGGASLVIPIVIIPPPRETWQILGYAITAQLALTRWADLQSASGPVWFPVAQSFGKLGKIVAGLWTRASISTNNAQNNAQSPMLPLPPDASLLSDLFNPDVDDLPPSNFFKTSPQAIYGQALMSNYITEQNLAQPIDVAKASPISLVCTMFPSLAQNMELRIMSLQYSVKYQSSFTGMAP